MNPATHEHADLVANNDPTKNIGPVKQGSRYLVIGLAVVAILSLVVLTFFVRG